MAASVSVYAAGLAALLALSGCGGAASSSSSGSPELTITAPANGATVGRTFKVAWDSNVKLGAPKTGRDHVHVFVDGHKGDFTVVAGRSFMVKGLSPGRHVVNVTLQHSDHSAAGPQDQVDVKVSRSATSGSTSTPSSTGQQYGY